MSTLAWIAVIAGAWVVFAVVFVVLIASADDRRGPRIVDHYENGDQ